MCSNGQYAAFSVNKMHISKHYVTSSSLLNAPKQHTIQTRSPARKKYNKKTTFSRKYFPILLNQGTSSLWPYSDSLPHFGGVQSYDPKTEGYFGGIILITSHTCSLVFKRMPDLC